MKSQDQKIQQMLQDFGRAVVDAINDSSDVSGAARRLCDHGYSLYLQLDCKPDSTGRAQVQLGAVRTSTEAEKTSECEPLVSDTPEKAPSGPPSFRVNTRDVAFLQSVGIDPTRSVRRRRSSRR